MDLQRVISIQHTGAPRFEPIRPPDTIRQPLAGVAYPPPRPLSMANVDVAQPLLGAMRTPGVEPPRIRWIETQSTHRVGVIDLPAQWLEPASSSSPQIERFRRWVTDHVPQPDARSRLEAKRVHSAAHCMPTGLLDTLLDTDHPAITVEPLSRLEVLLFATHLQFRGHDAYAELGAKVYRNGARLRVFVISSSTASVRFDSAVLRARETEAMRDGWVPWTHLHSHPFNPANQYGDLGGTPAPSAPDLRAYAQQATQGTREAWITNGFETLRLQLSPALIDLLFEADGGDAHRPDCKRWP